MLDAAMWGTPEQRWASPSRPRPIVIIGAGGIVRDAHVPAYLACGLPIAGVFDVDRPKAIRLASDFGLPTAFESFSRAVTAPDAVFDLALPPGSIEEVLTELPRGSAVLIQKPFGRDLAEATRLVEICRQRSLVAAVNFQLRFAPGMLALRDVVQRGRLGVITDLDVTVRCKMPWDLWPFLRVLTRMEIPLHSIHYLDSLRALMGEPQGVYARTVKHPDAPQLASSKSSIILDYGDFVRCSLSTNHHHNAGPDHQVSEVTVEGTMGSAIYQMGVNLDYPQGRPDTLKLAQVGGPWTEIPLVGSWFPDAFRGPMSNLQRFLAGEDNRLVSPVQDAWRTMALVEACYLSNDGRGTRWNHEGPSS